MHFVKFEKYNYKHLLQRSSEVTGNYLHCFCLKFIYEANNKLLSMVVSEFKIPSSADPTMNADLGCMLFAAIEVNI